MHEPLVGRRLSVGNRTVHLIEEGEGPPVVILHGCGSLAQEVFAAMATRFPDRRLIAIDRPGYGLSDPLDPLACGPIAQGAWLTDVLDALGLDRIVLAAHSIGSAPALVQALARPERLDGLLLVAPFCRPTPHMLLPLLKVAGAPLVGDFLRHRLVPALADHLGPGRLAAALAPNPVPGYLASFPYAHAARPAACLAMASEVLAFNADMAAVAERLPTLAVPTVVLAGALDRIAPPSWHAAWLADLAPAVELRVLAGVGHAPHHADPEAVVDAIDALAAGRPERMQATEPARPAV
jgi:pimeloyl-ACP methyl ester carboxylesterase